MRVAAYSLLPLPSLPAWLAAVLLRVGLPFALLVLVWLPHYRHFYIDRTPVGAATATAAAAAALPAASVLDEISAMHFAISLGVAPERVVATADEVLQGVVDLPSLFKDPLPLRGYPDDLRRGTLRTQLILASLALEGLLLDAYDRSRDSRYLRRAVERVREFSAYESSRYEASDFLWNDHAVAARIAVLAHLWRVSRDSPLVSDEERRDMVSLVQRCGRLLAKPAQFTVRTNHGVMQNVALLQIGAAFPFLPEVTQWRDLAVQRLSLQAEFYVSPEGFVLEHSAQYHAFGSELLAQALRLYVLNGISPPAWLVGDVRSTVQILGRMIRPDGSLPLLGNTDGGERFGIPSVSDDGDAAVSELAPVQQPDTRAPLLLPVAGYALWWNQDAAGGLLSQTLINWSKHDGHGHKHADEGAVQWWADGVDWITSTGYWPYDEDGMSDAYGWRSSNATHRIDEVSSERRATELLGYVSSSTLRALDLQRRGEDGGSYRRQLVQIDAGTLLVLDFTEGAGKGSETIWTVSPQLSVGHDVHSGLYVASAPGAERRLWISIDSPPAARIELLRGSRSPFAGWVVSNNVPQASDALSVTTPLSASVGATLFSLRSGSAAGVRLHLAPDATAENWQATLDDGKTIRSVKRNSKLLSVDDALHSGEEFSWGAGPALASERDTLKEAYAKATQLYPQWRDLSVFRRKLAYAIVATAAIGELVWQVFVRTRLATARRRRIVGLAIAVFWGAIGTWAIGFYLA